MEFLKKKISFKMNSFGEWILDHRAIARLTNILLLPLYMGAIINVVLLAMLLAECGTFEKIVACILLNMMPVLCYGFIMNSSTMVNSFLVSDFNLVAIVG